jgi:threonyl-tRNA synthetase
VDWHSIRNLRLAALPRAAGGELFFRHSTSGRVLIVALDDRPVLMGDARSIVNEFRPAIVRVEVEFSATRFQTAITGPGLAKIHMLPVIGDRDMEAGNVSVRLHGKGNIGAKPKGEVVADILQIIKERRA